MDIINKKIKQGGRILWLSVCFLMIQAIELRADCICDGAIFEVEAPSRVCLGQGITATITKAECGDKVKYPGRVGGPDSPCNPCQPCESCTTDLYIPPVTGPGVYTVIATLSSSCNTNTISKIVTVVADGESCDTGRCCGGDCIELPITPCDPGNPDPDDTEQWSEQLNEECKVEYNILGNPSKQYCLDGEVYFTQEYDWASSIQSKNSSGCGSELYLSVGGGSGSIGVSLFIFSFSWDIVLANFEKTIPGKSCHKIRAKYGKQKTNIKADWDIVAEISQWNGSDWVYYDSINYGGAGYETESGWKDHGIKANQCYYKCAP